MLTVNNIEVIYSDVILVLRGISITVEAGQIVTILGANGAGKSTTLKAISGLLISEEGEVTRGSIDMDGRRIDRLSAETIVRELGIVQVLEGRRQFQHLTVEENLLVGAIARGADRAMIDEDLERVYHYFPQLKDLRKGISGYLSGGEQQMLVIGRGLMARPQLLLLDEPSIGLAPLLVQEIFKVIKRAPGFRSR
jgi:branched-chain amino acid transport system ATP-binding protein